MASQSSTPLWDNLHQKTIDRLFADAPGFEFLILKAHLVVEHALDVLIDGALKRPARLRKRHRLKFEFKVDLAQALGVLPDTHVGPIKALNKVRNAIAHVDGYTIEVNDLLAFRLEWDAATVRGIRREFVGDPTEATRTATGLLVWKCLELVADHELKGQQ